MKKTLLYFLRTGQFFFVTLATFSSFVCNAQHPADINFVRKGAVRMIFDEDQSIPLATLNPEKIVGMSIMHPITYYAEEKPGIEIRNGKLLISSESGEDMPAKIWFGGFNPFATYTLDIAAASGNGEFGFQFSDQSDKEQFFVTFSFENQRLTKAIVKITASKTDLVNESLSIGSQEIEPNDKIILQMLGSGLVLYLKKKGDIPKVIAQYDYNSYLDLRAKKYINSFQSNLFIKSIDGKIELNKVEMALTTGNGLADIRAITYENGAPYLDSGRLWYTMSIRGKSLANHTQGVFSLDPSVFDIRLEGIIVFDRKDGILRNDIASHIFYDRNNEEWRGLTTGFSAYANRDKEKKQLIAITSKEDPRFGFSVMRGEPLGIVGSYEDPHLLFDEEAGKWRLLVCNNIDGFKAIMLESDQWNKGFQKIAGPVRHDATGTSVQTINGVRYCFSGSAERAIYIYDYPTLNEVGTLKMDLPPWDEVAKTRVWPNVVQLREDYPFKYVALMMDRLDYPDLKRKHWTYGAIYLYHGYDED